MKKSMEMYEARKYEATARAIAAGARASRLEYVRRPFEWPLGFSTGLEGAATEDKAGVWITSHRRLVFEESFRIETDWLLVWKVNGTVFHWAVIRG